MSPETKAARHTPGPWQVEKQPSYSPHRIFVNGANGHQITFFKERRRGSHRGEEAHWVGFMPGAEEDAHLIAAAPEMLEALEKAIPYMEEAEKALLVGHEGCHWPAEIVRAAIRKAKGESL